MSSWEVVHIHILSVNVWKFHRINTFLRQSWISYRFSVHKFSHVHLFHKITFIHYTLNIGTDSNSRRSTSSKIFKSLIYKPSGFRWNSCNSTQKLCFWTSPSTNSSVPNFLQQYNIFWRLQNRLIRPISTCAGKVMKNYQTLNPWVLRRDPLQTSFLILLIKGTNLNLKI